jgi:hypothetical protein
MSVAKEISGYLRHKRVLARMKDELYIRAVEYARMHKLEASLEDGCWHLHIKTDSDRRAKYLLEEVGAYAVRILRETTVVPLERNALTTEEQRRPGMLRRLINWSKTVVLR